MIDNTKDPRLEQTWATLKDACKTEQGMHVVRLVLNDLRVRYHLDTPQLRVNDDGTINEAMSMRAATAFEVHQIYADLVPIDRAAEYQPELTQ